MCGKTGKCASGMNSSIPNEITGGVARSRISALSAQERIAFAAAHQVSRAALERGAGNFLNGVPLHWMSDWSMPFPMLVEKARGAKLTDIDGVKFDDFCLGDTGSMFGHSPKPVAKAIRRQAANGLTYMLPTPDAMEVGKLLTKRFGPFQWQIATTATDANRFALRVARAVTGRKNILVFNACYHGTVDETFVRLEGGKAIHRPGLVGQAADLTENTVVVEFNDIAALEKALAARDIACVITEPVLTNSCMVLPAPGFHKALRKLTRDAGTLLLIDETHTISTGLGGYTKTHDLEPDIFVLGKPVAGGVPASVWGLSPETSNRFLETEKTRPAGHSGMGTTLSANPMQFAAMRACLAEVMTKGNYAHMETLADELEASLRKIIRKRGLPWHVARCGARVEFICAPGPLKNGTESEAAHQPELEKCIHLALLNRGSLIAPFHNMMLISPSTKRKQVERLVRNFADVTSLLTN
jgi:glutamate-1-semialdehyde 2,1-aminomutase